jgi:putative SOS response-associated peptidase YedK
MCGRYQRRSDKQRIAEAFHLGSVEEVDSVAEVDLAPNYNIAPGTMQPIVVWDEDLGMRTLRMMYWRFLPPFCTDPKKLKFDTIHASAEKLLSSNVWRNSFLYRRCLIPADSFVEWKKVNPKIKLPFLFSMKDDEPFGIAGIWQHWRSPDRSSEFDTFAVVTVEPNEIVHNFTDHDRMPLLIAKPDYERWLREEDLKRPPVDLLRPFDSDKMKAWRVGTKINSVRNNEASLIEPCDDELPETESMAVKAQKSNQLEMF